MPAKTYHSVSLQVLAITMLSAVTHAQTVTGNVEGRVIDPAGAVVPGATVRAKEASTGALRATRTNSDGFYEFSYLGPGDYELTVEASGFERQSGRAGVTLNRVDAAGNDMGQLVVTTSWEHPTVRWFDEGALRLDAGEGLRFTCAWDNPDDHEVHFGVTSEDEMCFVTGYFYPDDESQPLPPQPTCFPQGAGLLCFGPKVSG